MLANNFVQFCSRAGNNYYPQVLLEQCKYVVKGGRIVKYITNNIAIFSDFFWKDSDKEKTNKGNFDEENSDVED